MGDLIQFGLHKRNKESAGNLFAYSDGITKIKFGSERLNKLERLSEEFQVSVSDIIRQAFDYAVEDIKEGLGK